MSRKGVLILAYFGLLIATVYSVTPLVFTVFNSLKTHQEWMRNPLGLPANWRFDNYLQAFVEGKFYVFMRNSFIYTGIGVPILCIFSLIAAYALNRINSRLSSILLSIFLLGLGIPPTLYFVPLAMELDAMNLIDTHVGVLLSYIAANVSFSVFFMSAYLAGFPKELEDSARVDGCSTLGVIRHIIIPLCKPALVSLAVLLFVFIWNDLLIGLAVTRSEVARPIMAGFAYFYGIKGRVDIPLISAGAILSALPALLLYITFHRSYIQGLITGLKG